MNVAFLFNSDHQSLGGYYGPPIKRAILGTRVLQESSRRVPQVSILRPGKAQLSITPHLQASRSLYVLARRQCSPAHQEKNGRCDRGAGR